MTDKKRDDSILRDWTGALFMIQGEQYVLLKEIFRLAFRNKSIRNYITKKCGEKSEKIIEKLHHTLSPEDKPPSTTATCPHCNRKFEFFILTRYFICLNN